MFSTNTERNVIDYNRRLNKIGSWAIPSAVANTLDNVAFEARKESINQFEKDHTIRSTWTQRGMLFEKTRRGFSIAAMESRAGNIRPYAGTLETGGIIAPRAKVLMSPALAARGGNKRKRIKPSARLGNLTPRRMPKVSGGPRRRFAAMLNLARKENYFGPFLITKSEAGGERLPQGIFNVGRAGRKKRGGGTIIMLRKIQASAKVTGHSFVGAGARRASRDIQKIYNRNAARILRKVR